MGFVEILKALLFGIVEGVTEWLPVSSTGHMIILNELMPLKVSDSFYSLFEVVIQLVKKRIEPFGVRAELAANRTALPERINAERSKLAFHGIKAAHQLTSTFTSPVTKNFEFGTLMSLMLGSNS